MTLNEKFAKVSGLSLDIESMIATCPVDKKEELFQKLSWNIGLLLSTEKKEGKFTSDGSDKAETLKEIYNLLISIPTTDPQELKEAFDTLVPGVHKTVEVEANMKIASTMNISAGCSATLNVPAGVKLDVSGATGKQGIEVLGEMEIDCDGEISAKTAGGNGSRIANVKVGGSLKIDSGKFTANQCVDINGGKSVINAGEFSAVEPCIGFFTPDVEGKNSELTINGGEFTSSDNGVLMGNGTAKAGNPCKVTIKGGVYNANITSAGYVACGIYCPNCDEIEIDGATFNITDGCCICSRAGKITIKNSVINMIYTAKALEAGKVGDSRVVVPCVPFVFDEAAGYPALANDAKIVIGENVTINYTGEYIHSGKKAALVTGTATAAETKFDEEIEARIFGI